MPTRITSKMKRNPLAGKMAGGMVKGALGGVGKMGKLAGGALNMIPGFKAEVISVRCTPRDTCRAPGRLAHLPPQPRPDSKPSSLCPPGRCSGRPHAGPDPVPGLCAVVPRSRLAGCRGARRDRGPRHAPRGDRAHACATVAAARTHVGLVHARCDSDRSWTRTQRHGRSRT